MSGGRARTVAPGVALAAELFTAFLMWFCVTILWFGMRGVMELGGFVATGGPYAIAHPAPDWVWVVPVSIVTMMICVFANAAAASMLGQDSLMVVLWSVVFLSLGWNFLEFGFQPPVGQQGAIAWIICGVTFMIMGGAGVLMMFNVGLRNPAAWRRPADADLSQYARDTAAYSRRLYIGLNVAVFAAAVALGAAAFAQVAG